MPSSKFRVKDNSADQKYFAIVPRIVSATCRDPFELAVWVTIKEVAGESGECWLSTDNLAALSGMSVGKASQARAWLIYKRLLVGEQRQRDGTGQKIWHISIPDMWAENVKFAEAHPKIDDRIAYKQSLQGVKPSPDETLTGYKPSCGEGFPESPSQENPKSLHVVETKKNQTIGSAQDEGKPVCAAAIADGTPAPEPTPKRTAYQVDINSLTVYFSEVSGLAAPEKKKGAKEFSSKAINAWFVPLGEIYRLCERDMDRAKKLIAESVGKLDADNLTLSSPISIVKTAQHFLRGINGNGQGVNGNRGHTKGGGRYQGNLSGDDLDAAYEGQSRLEPLI